MKIRDEHPPTSGTDSWGLEPLKDVAELASYLGLSNMGTTKSSKWVRAFSSSVFGSMSLKCQMGVDRSARSPRP